MSLKRYGGKTHKIHDCKFIRSDNLITKNVYYSATISSNPNVPFQRNYEFGEVRLADEKHLSADTNVIGVAESLITICAKLRTVLL